MYMSSCTIGTVSQRRAIKFERSLCVLQSLLDASYHMQLGVNMYIS